VRRVFVGALVLLASCSPPAASTGSPSPPTHSGKPSTSQLSTSIAPEPLGILATAGWGVGPGSPDGHYAVYLVGKDGRVGASVQASGPADLGLLTQYEVEPPLVNASNSRVYYLEGDADVRFLLRDGSTGLATHIPGNRHARATFAVSPDDRRVAVSVIDYVTDGPGIAAPHASLHVYVEDLSGGSHHVDIFSSDTLVEWPVGWHAGNLVIGTYGALYRPSGTPNYRRDWLGYHIVDPATGSRLATIGASSCGVVAMARAGAVCNVSGHDLSLQTWDGSSRTFPRSAGLLGGIVSPDGLRIAAQQPAASGPGAVVFATTDGPSHPVVPGNPLGWIDDTHLVFTSFSAANALAIWDTDANTSVPIVSVPQGANIIGTLPPGLN